MLHHVTGSFAADFSGVQPAKSAIYWLFVEGDNNAVIRTPRDAIRAVGEPQHYTVLKYEVTKPAQPTDNYKIKVVFIGCDAAGNFADVDHAPMIDKIAGSAGLAIPAIKNAEQIPQTLPDGRTLWTYQLEFELTGNNGTAQFSCSDPEGEGALTGTSPLINIQPSK